MRKWAVVLAVGFGCTVALGGCRFGAGRQETDFPEPPRGPSDPAAHADLGDRLRSAMNELQRDTSRFWPQELEGSSSGGRPAEEVFTRAGELSHRLADTAQALPALVDDSKLDDADRRAFRAQSEVLRQEALLLADAAERRDTADMRLVLHRIGETCTSCHQRFTSVAGPLTGP